MYPNQFLLHEYEPIDCSTRRAKEEIKMVEYSFILQSVLDDVKKGFYDTLYDSCYFLDLVVVLIDSLMEILLLARAIVTSGIAVTINPVLVNNQAF
jgi:hypothetical protein